MISRSPLCPHIENPHAKEWKDWLARIPVKPRAVKVFAPEAAWAVKQIDPKIRTVLRIYVPDYNAFIRRGRDGGREFVRSIDDLRWVDYLEFPNEPGVDPDLNEAVLGFVEACALQGVKPIAFNFAVGTPEVFENGKPTDRWIRIILPAIRSTLLAGGALGYHSYGPANILQAEEWLAFRSVLSLTPLIENLLLIRPRWVHTESGYDRIAQYPQSSGPWRELVGRGILKIEDIQAGLERLACRASTLGVPYVFLYTFWTYRDDDPYRLDPDLLPWYEQHLAAWGT